MDDQRIIALYWARAEDAIRETSGKYGGLCQAITGRILASPEDREECLNDTWLGLWNAIPPQRPARLSVFVGRVARNLALKRFDYLSASRRRPEAVCSLEELGEELKKFQIPKIVVGDGTELCYNSLRDQISELEPAPVHLRMQSAWGVARAAEELARAGGLVSGGELAPVYHRLSQAERERLERETKSTN